jgi:hypothetical protein
MSEWEVRRNSDVAGLDELIEAEREWEATRKQGDVPEEIPTMDNDQEFESFKKTLEDLMASLPDDEHRARMTTVLSTLSERMDEPQITKSAIRKSALALALGALDKLSEQHGEAGLITKALRDADQTQAERALLNEPESTTPLPFRDVVEQAIKRAAFTVPQIAPLNMYEQRAREVRAEIAAEAADTSTPLTKGNPPADMVRDIVKHLEEYRDWLVATAGPTDDKEDIKRRVNVTIDAYKAWLSRES